MKKHSADARKMLAALLWRYRKAAIHHQWLESLGINSIAYDAWVRKIETWSCYIAARDALNGQH
jgi:hypothetical protein